MDNKALLSIFGAIMVAMIGGLGAFGGTLISSMQDRNELLAARVDKHEIELREILTDKWNVEKVNIELSYKLNSTTDDKKVIEGFLDSIRFPAMAKVYNEKTEEFTTLFVNRAFERMFNRSRHLLKGKSDEEFWGKEAAAEFYKDDYDVFSNRSSKCFNETVEAQSFITCKNVLILDNKPIGVTILVVPKDISRLAK